MTLHRLAHRLRRRGLIAGVEERAGVLCIDAGALWLEVSADGLMLLDDERAAHGSWPGVSVQIQCDRLASLADCDTLRQAMALAARFGVSWHSVCLV